MPQETLLTTQIAILILLLVACLGAIAFRRLHFPYTVGLVIIGLALGFLAQQVEALAGLATLTLSPELILFIFLPPLIFESALNLDSQLLLHNLTPVITLAAPGLLLSTALIGSFLSWLTPLSLPQALLFGSLISATDPVAVIALFKELGVPKRLIILVEGESMFNDATAIVIFNLILTAITSGEFAVSTLGQGLWKVLITFMGGVLVGLIAAIVMAYFIMRAKENSLIQSTASAVVAYAAFIVAEHYLHVSGVIAVMSAGLTVGWYNYWWIKPKVKNYLHGFWEYASFLANSLIFLLVGLTTSGFIFRLHETDHNLWLSIGWAIIFALIARSAVVFSLISFLNRFVLSESIDWRNQTISLWGGLRGAVALALALSLNSNFANRELIIAMTLGVALFTIIGSGSTIKKVIQVLKLDQPSILEQLWQAQAIVAARREVLEQVVRLEKTLFAQEEVIENLKQKYQRATQQAEQSLAAIWTQLNISDGQVRQVLWLQALAIENQAYLHLHEKGLTSNPTLRRLELVMKLKQDAVLSLKIPPPTPTVTPLETGLERSFVRLISRIVPHKGLLRWQRLRAARIRYEYDTAVAYAGDQVAREIRHLTREHCLETTVAQECSLFYQRMSSAAIHRLEAKVESVPELAITLERQIAKQAALIIESEVIEELVASGAIPEGVMTKVLNLIEKESPC